MQANFVVFRTLSIPNFFIVRITAHYDRFTCITSWIFFFRVMMPWDPEDSYDSNCRLVFLSLRFGCKSRFPCQKWKIQDGGERRNNGRKVEWVLLDEKSYVLAWSQFGRKWFIPVGPPMPAFSTISLGSSDGGTFVFFNKTSRSKFVCFLFFSIFFSLLLYPFLYLTFIPLISHVRQVNCH